jgi:ABC-type nitrate/sulfonate/bicarbonate transport system permease component
MTTRPRSPLSAVLTFLVLSIGGVIATTFRSALEDEAKSRVAGSLKEAAAFFVSSALWWATLDTIVVFALTGLATVIFGLFLAWTMYSSKWMARILEPAVQLMRPIPSIATIAIGTLILSTTSSFLAMLVAFLGSLWPFTYVALETFRRVPVALRESTLSLGKKESVFYRRVLFLASLRGLFSAVRLVAPITLLLTVTTQYFYPSLGGLGAILFDKHSGLKYPEVVCIVMMLSLIGITIELLLEQIEKRVCKWRIEPVCETK